MAISTGHVVASDTGHPADYYTTDNRQFSTGAQRDNNDAKGRFDLLPPDAIMLVAQLFQKGANHYGDRNWEKGQPLGVLLDSALRHTFKLMAGWTDEDHAVSAVWNLLCLIQTREWIKSGRLPGELNDLNIQL